MIFRKLNSLTINEWLDESKEAGYEDFYEYVSSETGLERYEVKIALFASMYGDPLRMEELKEAGAASTYRKVNNDTRGNIASD